MFSDTLATDIWYGAILRTSYLHNGISDTDKTTFLYWIRALIPPPFDSNVESAPSRAVIHGPLTRYVKLRVAYVPGMPGTFSSSTRVSDPDMHHGTCVTHVPWCMSGSQMNSFFWSRWREKCSEHSLRMRTPQVFVSGKRPIDSIIGSYSWDH